MVSLTNWSAARTVGPGGTLAPEFAVLHPENGAFYSDTLVATWNKSAGVVDLMDPGNKPPLYPLSDTELVAEVQGTEFIDGNDSWLRSTRSVRSLRTACPAVSLLRPAIVDHDFQQGARFGALGAIRSTAQHGSIRVR